MQEAVIAANVAATRILDDMSSSCDLSGVVGDDLGIFATRDELFARHRTMPRVLQAIADPVLGRWAPHTAAAVTSE
jgi:hypothetical protein